MNDEDCIDILNHVIEVIRPNSDEFEYHTLHKICSKGKKKIKQGIFTGDSGGPLICDDELQGVSSQSLVHGRLNNPTFTSIFTDVTYYIDWINGVFKENGEPAIPDNIVRSQGTLKINIKFLTIFSSAILLIFS